MSWTSQEVPTLLYITHNCFLQGRPTTPRPLSLLTGIGQSLNARLCGVSTLTIVKLRGDPTKVTSKKLWPPINSKIINQSTLQHDKELFIQRSVVNCQFGLHELICHRMKTKPVEFFLCITMTGVDVQTGTFPFKLKTQYIFHRTLPNGTFSGTFHQIKIESWDQLIQQTTTAVCHDV